MSDDPRCQHGETIFQDQDRHIEQFGYSVMCVFGSDEGPGFVYTIGLSEKGMTDLIFIGDSSPNAAAYIQGAASAQIAGEKLTMGRIEPIWTRDDSDAEIAAKFEAAMTSINGFPVPMFVIEADDRLDTHAFGVRRRLAGIESDGTPRLAQVVMPDMSGRFPWEPGYGWLDQDVKSAPSGTYTA